MDNKKDGTLTKYFVSGIFAGIKPVECTRESDKCVWRKISTGEHREKKCSRDGTYYDTWQQAHAHLIDMANSALARAKRDVVEARVTLKEVQNMAPEATDNG